MEIFKSVSPSNSELFIEVSFDFEYLARTWVMSELIDNNQKNGLIDSQPGNGLISYAKIGSTNLFRLTKRLVIVTYLDLQKISNLDSFLNTFKIDYHLVEDDNIPKEFYKSEHFSSKKTEIVLSDNKKIALVTKVIEIK